MGESRPCPEFVPPAAGIKYGGYCGRCSYSRRAHEMWDQWTAEAEKAVAK